MCFIFNTNTNDRCSAKSLPGRVATRTRRKEIQRENIVERAGERKSKAASSLTAGEEKKFKRRKLEACWAVSRDRQLGAVEICILQRIIDKVLPQHDNCMLSVNDLVEWAGVNPRTGKGINRSTVMRTIAKAERFGLLRVRRGDWQTRECNVYEPIWENLTLPRELGGLGPIVCVHANDAPSSAPESIVCADANKSYASTHTTSYASTQTNSITPGTPSTREEIATQSAAKAGTATPPPGGAGKAPAAFSQIWRAHPYGRKDFAKKAFNAALVNGFTGEEILTGLQSYLGGNPDKPDYLAKWLANEGWHNASYTAPKKAAKTKAVPTVAPSVHAADADPDDYVTIDPDTRHAVDRNGKKGYVLGTRNGKTLVEFTDVDYWYTADQIKRKEAANA